MELFPRLCSRPDSEGRSLLPSSTSRREVAIPQEISLPKVSWADLAQAAARAHLLAARLDASFFGGKVANDPFDSHRLREAVNLMARVCTQLKLPGAHAATTSRAQGASLVLCLFELPEDRDKVAELAAPATPGEAGEWASRREFLLCARVHDRLVAVGGETDNRYAGRRRRDRDREAAAQTLRWGDI